MSRKSTFNDANMKSISGPEYSQAWYPLKKEIETLFTKYGYTNLEVAYLCSFASKRDIEKYYPRYERFYSMMVIAAKLKCPMIFKKDTPSYIDDETRQILLESLQQKIKAEFGKWSWKYYEDFYRHVLKSGVELGWNPYEFIRLVEKEMGVANGGDTYKNLDSIHKKDEVISASDRAIEYVNTHYDKYAEEMPSDHVSDDYVDYDLQGSLDAIDYLLFKECEPFFSSDEILLPDLNKHVLPWLNDLFTKNVSCNPMRLMIAQYRCLFDTGNDTMARLYYHELEDVYKKCSFPDFAKPSTYVAAQYLFSVITSKPVCDSLPIRVGSLICDLLALFGYIPRDGLSVADEKEKYDMVKRFLKTDKDTGVYSRLV